MTDLLDKIHQRWLSQNGLRRDEYKSYCEKLMDDSSRNFSTLKKGLDRAFTSSLFFKVKKSLELEGQSVPTPSSVMRTIDRRINFFPTMVDVAIDPLLQEDLKMGRPTSRRRIVTALPEFDQYLKSLSDWYDSHGPSDEWPYDYAMAYNTTPSIKKQISNNASFLAYPAQVTTESSLARDHKMTALESTIMRGVLDQLTCDYEFSGISIPKDSSVGLPYPVNSDKVKRLIFDTQLANIRDVSALLADGGDEASIELFANYAISPIALQGSRIQNDSHGEKGKSRPFVQGKYELKTCVDYPGAILEQRAHFARRLRMVYGPSYGTNCLMNLLIYPVRNFYYKRYQLTYKVRSADDLTQSFRKCVFIWGSDVTQLDNNVSRERIVLMRRYLLRFVKGMPDMAKDNLINAFTSPAIIYHPSSVDLGALLMNQPLCWNRGDDAGYQFLGIPSGAADTSELGKFEMTSYYVIQLHHASNLLNAIKDDSHFANACSEFFSQLCLSGKAYDHATSVMVSSNAASIFMKLSFDDIATQWLANHFEGMFVFKNCGDDTIIGCSREMVPLMLCFLLVMHKANSKERDTSVYRFISSMFSRYSHIVKSCDWHVVEEEVPVKYLGNLLYTDGSSFKFLPNPQSFVLNTFLPEKSVLVSKPKTWGLAKLAQLEHYKVNPLVPKIAARVDSLFSTSFQWTRSSFYDLAKTHYVIHDPTRSFNVGSMSFHDRQALADPTVIHYKVDPSDLSAEVRRLVTSYVSFKFLVDAYKYLYGDVRSDNLSESAISEIKNC